jgi:23S rRNA (guanosine2251-2'-O)-methyltransferase
MEAADFDLIIGIHSISAAIKNPSRNIKELVLTDEGEQELLKRGSLSRSELSNLPVQKVANHKLQELSKKYYKQLNLDYQRVPSQVFLVADSMQMEDPGWLYRFLENKTDAKVLCLDQITDVHNAAAIMRTASFYGIDAVVVPNKKSFGLTPSFFRIASGASEYVNLVWASNLSKVVSKLNDLGVMTVGLSEHSENPFSKKLVAQNNGLCLVLGKEDTGISNAVMRQVKYQLSLESLGEIKSLNVAAAAAISMEKCFSLS